MYNNNMGYMNQSRPRKTTSYNVDGIAIGSKTETKSAYDELAIYQEMQRSFDDTIMDYKTWAKESVNYSNFTANESMSNLRKCNDAYVLSTMSNCLTPLREGLSLSSVLSCLAMTKTVRTMNPDLDMDMSRTISVLRGAMIANFGVYEQQHPHMATLLRPFVNAMENASSGYAMDKMNSNIALKLKEHDVDNMVMLPRQVAALKLNFMEQCYRDMRNTTDQTVIDRCEREYNIAVEHLNEIAKNSGYDMSVVACEERYLVGLKIMENPQYANIFNETEGVYGAKPVITNTDSVPTWGGTFYTADSHEYTVGGHAQSGAFTVRKPITTKYDMSNFTDNMSRKATQFASMMAYLHSGECKLPVSAKRGVEEELSNTISAYEDGVKSLLLDDGICKSNKDADKIWKSCFEEKFLKTTDSFLQSSICKSDGKTSKLGDQDMTTFKDFCQELNHIVDKEVLTKAGFGYTSATEAAIASNGKTSDPIVDRVKKEIDQRASNNGKQDSRTGVQIIRDMRYNYIDSMPMKDVVQLMLHTGTNMEQGIMAHGDYTRAQPVATKSDKSDDKSDSKTTGTKTSRRKKSGRPSKKSTKSRAKSETPVTETSVEEKGKDLEYS